MMFLTFQRTVPILVLKRSPSLKGKGKRKGKTPRVSRTGKTEEIFL
jgi:hypothetical protein